MIYSLGTPSTFFHFADDELLLPEAASLETDSMKDMQAVTFLEDSSFESPRVFLTASLCGRFLAVVSPFCISILSAGQRRVSLGRLQRSISTLEFGPHTRALWSTDGSILYVGTSPGYNVCIYRFVKDGKQHAVVNQEVSGCPQSIVGLGETIQEIAYSDAETDEDERGSDIEESSVVGDANANKLNPPEVGYGVRRARRKLMVLSENRMMKNSRKLTFAAVLRLPVAISDMALSLECLIFSCKSMPVLFTMQQAQPRDIKGVIEFESFVYNDGTSWLSSMSRHKACCEVSPTTITSSAPQMTSRTQVDSKEERHSDFRARHLLYAMTTSAPSLLLHLKSLQDIGVGSTLRSAGVTRDSSVEMSGAISNRILALESQKVGVRQFELNESLDFLAVVLTSGAAAFFSWKQPFFASGASDFSLLHWVSLGPDSSPIFTGTSSTICSPTNFPWCNVTSDPDSSSNGVQRSTLANRSDNVTPIGICLYNSGVQMIKMNRFKRLAAIGMSNGIIELISLDGMFEWRSSVKRVCRIHPCDALSLSVPLKALGHITCLRWSEDGLALVAAWVKVGPVVFTHSGTPSN